MNNTQVSAASNTDSLQSKLDSAWSEVSKEQARAFLQRVITSQTTLAEIEQVLSYPAIQALKKSGEDVKLGDFVTTKTVVRERVVAPPLPRATPRRRMRSTKASIEQEQATLLMIVRDNPGLNRGDIARKMRGQMGNKSLSHVSYLLRKLNEAGQIVQHGERKGATYEAK